MKRVFIIVLDSFGIGALPDAANYGDQGSDTLAACFASSKLFVPQMQRLGLFNIQGVQVGQPCQSPARSFWQGWQSVRQARTPPPDTGS